MKSDFSPTHPDAQGTMPLDLSPEAERILQALEQGERAQIVTTMPAAEGRHNGDSHKRAQREE